jgi:hypothetical protein
MMDEKESDKIGRMGRSTKQPEDGMKSKRVENGIEKVGKGRKKSRKMNDEITECQR